MLAYKTEGLSMIDTLARDARKRRRRRLAVAVGIGFIAGIIVGAMFAGYIVYS